MESLARLLPAAVVWCLLASAAGADVRDYCGAYARDVANGRLSGGEILNGKAAVGTLGSRLEWSAVNGKAMAGCLAQYGDDAGGPVESVTVAATLPRIVSKPRPAAKKIAKSRRRSPSKAASQPRRSGIAPAASRHQSPAKAASKPKPTAKTASKPKPTPKAVSKAASKPKPMAKTPPLSARREAASICAKKFISADSQTGVYRTMEGPIGPCKVPRR